MYFLLKILIVIISLLKVLDHGYTIESCPRSCLLLEIFEKYQYNRTLKQGFIAKAHITFQNDLMSLRQ